MRRFTLICFLLTSALLLIAIDACAAADCTRYFCPELGIGGEHYRHKHGHYPEARRHRHRQYESDYYYRREYRRGYAYNNSQSYDRSYLSLERRYAPPAYAYDDQPRYIYGYIYDDLFSTKRFWANQERDRF